MAHGSTVNCMQIGRKSGSVMVTGGDDKKVNVWAIGRANAIMVRPRMHAGFGHNLRICVLGQSRTAVCRVRLSARSESIISCAGASTPVWNALTQSLSGHTSAVECVSFDSNEQTVIAGSAGGTLKLWDLEQAKVARTLTGHRSNCISVQVCARPGPANAFARTTHAVPLR